MIPIEQMPEDNAELAALDVTFQRLGDDSPVACPVDVTGVAEYLRLEGEEIDSGDLDFVRTADVDTTDYWLWRFQTDDGSECYASVSRSPEGQVVIGYEQNWYGLTPEQYILGDYHQVF